MRSQINEEITFRKPEVLLAYMEGGNLTDAAEKLDISAVSVRRARHSLLSSHTISIHSLVAMFIIATILPINMGVPAFIGAFLVGTLIVGMQMKASWRAFPPIRS